MSKNIIPTIGQHVFRYDPPKYTEKGAPVLACNPTKPEIMEAEKNNNEPKYQFLGSGYYFWDNNIQRAHRWGEEHCDGKYLICECSLVLQGESFLDLVGSREDLGKFLEVYMKMRKFDPNLKIGAFFYTMQVIAKYQPNTWPYTIIRALNVKRGKNEAPYNHLYNAKMLLDPEIIICFYNKNELNLQNSRYLDKNNCVWTPKI